MIKPHFETYRYTTEICQAKSQSIVECRLTGSEINTVLAVSARVVPTESTCADGEVRYGGKLYLCIVYEDADKNVCRAERGAEFTHKALNDEITPSCQAVVKLNADGVTERREGSGLFVSVIVGATAKIYGEKAVEYLSDGDGLILNKSNKTVVKAVPLTAETEVEDTFETDYLGDVLLHSETVNLLSAVAEVNKIVLTGEILFNACVLKSDSTLASYERTVPFKAEIPSDDALPEIPVNAELTVIGSLLTAGTDEEKGKSKLTLNATVKMDAEQYFRDEIQVVTDAYSTAEEVVLQRTEREFKTVVSTSSISRRVSGSATLSVPLNGNCVLQSAVMPRAEIIKITDKDGGTAEGVLFADVLYVDGDGLHKTARLTMPFEIPVSEYTDGVTGEATVCGLTVKTHGETGTDAEATVKLVARKTETEKSFFVTGAETGKAYEKKTCAVSVYMPIAGDGLWETAKKLRQTPEELEKNNPDLCFPLEGNERIFVYRQKT